MFKTLFRRPRFRTTVPALAMPILGAMVLAGGVAAAPAAAEPPQPRRIQSHSADLLVLAQSHREYRRDGSRGSRSEGNRWRQKGHGHEKAKRPHHRRHIVKRDWRRHHRGHYAKRYNWRRHRHGHHVRRHHWHRYDNRSRRDWGHQARRYSYR